MAAENTKLIRDSLRASQNTIARLAQDTDLINQIARVAQICSECLQQGCKILLAGNGGSAADCQHIAAELVGRYLRERQGLCAIALTTDTSALTAIANDMGFAQIFARQIQAIGRPGDVLIAYSTSGNSTNILNAVRQANDAGMISIGMTGAGCGEIDAMVDHVIAAPSTDTPHIQECHLIIGHLLCDLIEKKEGKP